MMEKFKREYSPNVSVNMQNSYQASLKHLIPFFGNTNLMLVSRKSIYGYKVLRKKEGAKPSTINRELSMLSKAFNLAVKEWEWIEKRPHISKEKEDNERDRWLTNDEEKRLLLNCSDWLKDLVVFALNTGLRQGEQLSLEWTHVNLLRKTVTIQKTKSGKSKTIPLNQIAHNILIQRSEIRSIKNDFVFINGFGGKIDRSNLRRSFNSALNKAKIEDFHWHDLRHTFATRLAQNGVDIYKIAKLLGHQNVTMTQRYAHHCPDSLRDGVDILSAVQS